MRIRNITSILIAASVLFITTACGDSKKEDFDQRVAYPHRTCTSGGKGVKSGDKIKGGDIASGGGSFCDGQFKDGGARVAFRIFPNSKLSFERHKGNLHLRLHKGRMLIDAEKRGKGRGLYLHSGGSMVRMLGTKVLMTKKDARRLNVELLEGKVEVRSAPYLHLKSFKRGLSEKSEKSAAAAMPELFKSKVVVLEAGSSVRVSETNDPLAGAGELKAKLNQAFRDPKIQAAADADPAAFGRMVARAGTKTMASETDAAGIMKKNEIIMKKSSISGKRRWLHVGWTRGLRFIPTGAQTPERLKVLIRKRYGGKASQSILKDLKKKAPPSLVYRIVLKDGQVYQGRAEQEGTRYRLVTRKGDILIPKTKVDRIEIVVPRN